MELVGKAAYDGILTNYAVYGDFLYLVTNQINPDRYLLSVVDMSNPSHPHRVRSLGVGEIGFGLLTVDSLLYVIASEEDTLIIYSLDDPSNPQELARVGMGDSNWILERLKDDLIGSPQYYSYTLINFEDRLNPRMLLTIDLQYNPWNGILIDDYLYITGARSLGYFRYLEVFDISDTLNPTSVFIDTLGYAPFSSIGKIDDFIYLTKYAPGIEVFDVSDPVNPRLIDTVLTDFPVSDLLVSGNYVFASGSFDSLLTIDASDPINPIVVNAFYNRGGSGRFQLNEGNLYFFTAGIISMLDASDPTAPLLLGRYVPGDFARDVARWENYAYLVTNFGGFRIIDISDPTDPVGIGYFDSDQQTHKIYINEGILYLADNYAGVLVFSLADPADPELLSTIFLSANAYDMYVLDSLLYIADDDGFKIANIADPSNPVIVCDYPTLPFHNTCWTLIAYGDYVYTAELDSGFCIYDVSDFSNPFKIDCHESGNWTEFAISDTLLFASTYNYAFSIFDISNPSNPALISRTPPSAGAVSECEGLVYLIYYDAGVKVFDVADPNSPESVGTYVHSGFFDGLVVENDTAFVSAGEGGLWILHYQAPTDIYNNDNNIIPRSLSLKNHPNPFNASTTIKYYLPSKSDISLSIYNLLGQRVETLFKGVQDPGEHSITWDASRFPSGIYFARLEAAGRTENIKMVLLK
jgi:hypothetical protein